MITRGTWHPGIRHQVGSSNNAAKLDEAKVLGILASSMSNRNLARALDVHISTVRKVRRRVIWKHVVAPHRGLASGQYCTDNDCACQQYDWQKGPYTATRASLKEA